MFYLEFVHDYRTMAWWVQSFLITTESNRDYLNPSLDLSISIN